MTEKFRGVHPHKDGGYVVTLGRRNVHIGNYHTIEEARAAYDAAALIHHGDFACTNDKLDLQSA